MPGLMQIIVNGAAQDVAEGITVRELIQQSKLSPDKVAIELNRRLLKSEKYDTPLKPADEVEIVTFVGGG